MKNLNQWFRDPGDEEEDEKIEEAGDEVGGDE